MTAGGLSKPRCRRWRLGVASALLAGLALALGPGSVAGAQASSPCLGAASRAHPRCVDPGLRFEVRPSPADAEITPSAPCTLEGADDGIFHTLAGAPGGAYSLPGAAGGQTLKLCVFGDGPPAAQHGFALVGDSHAGTWRAALDAVARSLHLEGSSLTLASCTFSTARPILPAPLIVPCVQWRLAVVAWFRANPQVGTVFVSEHTSARVIPAPGTTRFDTAVAGYLAAWQALPPTVRHIVVLRDTPYVGRLAGPCVEQAIIRHQEAGRVCAVPRRRALRRDPEVVAARELGPRASVIDMSRFFCDSALCYPVIGGVLVYQDTNHMTRAYSDTLGPYLRHQVGDLLAAWPS